MDRCGSLARRVGRYSAGRHHLSVARLLVCRQRWRRYGRLQRHHRQTRLLATVGHHGHLVVAHTPRHVVPRLRRDRLYSGESAIRHPRRFRPAGERGPGAGHHHLSRLRDEPHGSQSPLVHPGHLVARQSLSRLLHLFARPGSRYSGRSGAHDCQRGGSRL